MEILIRENCKERGHNKLIIKIYNSNIHACVKMSAHDIRKTDFQMPG